MEIVLEILYMKTSNKKPLELVRVIWVDAEEHGEIGWNDFKSIQNYAKNMRKMKLI